MGCALTWSWVYPHDGSRDRKALPERSIDPFKDFPSRFPNPMAKFAENVKLLGRCGIIATIHREKAERMVASGEAVRTDKRTIRASRSLEDETLLPLREAVRVPTGQRYVYRQPVWGGTSECKVCGGTGCEVCDDRGHHPAITGHTAAFRKIEPEDAPLFRLSVTECLSA
jgi:hypothetical protein